MQEVKILPGFRALKLVNEQEKNKYYVISVVSNHDGEYKFPGALDTCICNFDDLERPPILLDKSQTFKLPNIEEVSKGILFARKYKNKPLVIHCFAGHSRSPAMAFCIAYDYFRDFAKTLDWLKNINDDIDPNLLVLKCGLEFILGDEKKADLVLIKVIQHPIWREFQKKHWGHTI